MSDANSNFVEIPKINPKTQEPPKQFLCGECGCTVSNRKQHLKWHEKIAEILRKADPIGDWPPIY